MSLPSFLPLQTAWRGICTQQQAINTTGHNIANANTPGYTRQQTVMQATAPYPTPALNSPAGVAQVGTGVEASFIQRIRDNFLDIQTRAEQCILGEWETRSDNLEQVEIIFNEPSNNSLNTLFGQFWNSWQELSKYPESSPVRTTVLETGTALTEAICHTYRQIETQQINLNKILAIKITDINSSAEQLARLNLQIEAVKNSGGRPNDLMDQRDKLLDEMAKTVNFSVTQTLDEPDQDSSPGIFTIKIGNQVLVSGNQANKITITTNTDADNREQQVLAWEDGSVIEWKDLRGELRGLQIVRDALLQPLLDNLDTLAQGMISEVNNIHQTGYNLTNQTGVAFFTGTGAKDIAIADTIKTNVAHIAAAANNLDPEGNVFQGDGTTALALAQLISTKLNLTEGKLKADPAGNTTFNGYYQDLIARLGVDAHEAARMVSNQQVLVQQLSNRREMLSGVAVDEEVTNLLQYQYAFQAAAKVISITDELLDTVVNRMG
jgi:flagellar hook-associated protein 1 FlgK